MEPLPDTFDGRTCTRAPVPRQARSTDASFPCSLTKPGLPQYSDRYSQHNSIPKQVFVAVSLSGSCVGKKSRFVYEN